MKKTESGQVKAPRQCWECLKRRLVCDFTHPHCKKCQKAGKDCPGYDEQKPLQWVQTGKVTSRRRKKDHPPKIYTVPSEDTGEAKCPSRTVETCSAGPKIVAPNDSAFNTILNSYLDSTLDFTLNSYVDSTLDSSFDSDSYLTTWKPSDEDHWAPLAEHHLEKVAKKSALNAAYGIEIANRVFLNGSRRKIEEVISKGLYDEASRMLNIKGNPIKGLERILRIMQMNDVPNYSYLSNETNEVVQAVQYYNVRIQPTLKVASKIAVNPALIDFPLAALHILPPAIHHILVCYSVNHFVHTLPPGTDKAITASNRSKVYQHRGAAIKELSMYVGKDKTMSSDMTIASILMFMCMELQNPAMADWRAHASGMKQLVDMRGGFKSLMSQAPHLTPTLVVYILILIVANACSPSWDQMEVSDSPEQNIVDIEQVYSFIFPYTLCPPTLFMEIVRINQLRQRASVVLLMGDMDANHVLEAHDILDRIETFSPEDWAQPGECYDEWLLIGTVFQASIALYCTMGFQSLTILPSTLEMNQMRSAHGDRLLKSLAIALKSPRLINFLMWPLTVAGVESAYRGQSTQYWVQSQLDVLSRHLGTSSPLKAQAVLRRYWQRQEPGWDECFDKPYVFAI
ncbi:fungal-specific transcription factor domain-containing protein [Phaeosphaeriaceae sp. PMI808]|nr:fungal-specific transcription factor domain-containing protein [Phaeosphaeriaceae sp. PMI808]